MQGPIAQRRTVRGASVNPRCPDTEAQLPPAWVWPSASPRHASFLHLLLPQPPPQALVSCARRHGFTLSSCSSAFLESEHRHDGQHPEGRMAVLASLTHLHLLRGFQPSTTLRAAGPVFGALRGSLGCEVRQKEVSQVECVGVLSGATGTVQGGASIGACGPEASRS